ncbi:cytosine permease [Ruminobacter amylophilus]|uniref:cytosine permease n=1 Tax=Ruminobacter amylophilus TaxID=867 RepID=UPI00386546E0
MHILKKDPEASDADYSFTPVPLNARKGFWPLLFVMVGFAFNSTGMAVGAKIGVGTNPHSFITAMLLGGLFLSAFTGVLGYIGSRTGMTYDQLCRRAYGSKAFIIPSAMLAVTQIGWFGVCSAMFAIPAAEFFECSPYLTISIAGLAMTTSAYIGFKGLEVISYIAVPLIIILGSLSLYLALSVKGLSPSLSSGPDVPVYDMNSMVALVIGSFISGGCSTPNFTRFAARPFSSVVSTVSAFMFGNSLMIVFGAAGAYCTGSDDIFYVMMSQGLVLSAFVVLGANIWTTNDNALYSSGLSLSSIFLVPKKIMVIAGGLLGTIAAFWLFNNFVHWLVFLSATLPAVGGILIADYFVFPYKYTDENTKSGSCIPALLGTVAGLVAGNSLDFGCAGINSIAAAVLVWTVLSYSEIKNRNRGLNNKINDGKSLNSDFKG